MSGRTEPPVRSIGTDPVAFTEFYRAHVDEVTRFVARRVADPQLVADLTAEVFHFQPNLAVDAAGRVAISAFALADGRMDEVLLISPTRGLSFGPPLRVTTAPFDPLDPATATRGKYGIWWLGDWQGITSGDGAFHVVWNDTRTGKLDLFAATLRP